MPSARICRRSGGRTGSSAGSRDAEAGDGFLGANAKIETVPSTMFPARSRRAWQLGWLDVGAVASGVPHAFQNLVSAGFSCSQGPQPPMQLG